MIRHPDNAEVGDLRAQQSLDKSSLNAAGAKVSELTSNKLDGDSIASLIINV